MKEQILEIIVKRVFELSKRYDENSYFSYTEEDKIKEIAKELAVEL